MLLRWLLGKLRDYLAPSHWLSHASSTHVCSTISEYDLGRCNHFNNCYFEYYSYIEELNLRFDFGRELLYGSLINLSKRAFFYSNNFIGVLSNPNQDFASISICESTNEPRQNQRVAHHLLDL